MDRKKNEKFVMRKARTESLQRSAVMHMQGLLNHEDFKKIKPTLSNNPHFKI